LQFFKARLHAAAGLGLSFVGLLEAYKDKVAYHLHPVPPWRWCFYLHEENLAQE
jgi:hypothetical protein